MNNTNHTPQALKPCPFCACAMRIESNRDWHRIFGNHTEACLFEEDTEQLMVPAAPDQLALMVECWNDRAYPAPLSGMKKVRGDLIAMFKAGQFDVIVHGQNCGCNMDDGIAKTIASEFPEALQADLRTRLWDRSKLGTYSYARVAAGVVVNGYTQFHFYGVGPNGGPLTDYSAMRSVFRALRQEFGGQSLRFAVPAIGAARAGGDWEVISAIIDEELAGEDVTFVEFDGVDALSGDYRRNIRPKVSPVAVQVVHLGAITPGNTDQNETGTWTAGIHVGSHGNKIEVHDNDMEAAEALRDAIYKALTGKASH